MPDLYAATSLDGEALAFVTSLPPRHGTLATINPSGTPHLAVVWYDLLPDGSVLLNSRVGRRWPNNLLRDPRCTMSIGDVDDWVAIRGDVVVVDDHEQAYQDIVSLARRYHPPGSRKLADSIVEFRPQNWISFHMRPRSVTVHL